MSPLTPVIDRGLQLTDDAKSHNSVIHILLVWGRYDFKTEVWSLVHAYHICIMVEVEAKP